MNRTSGDWEHTRENPRIGTCAAGPRRRRRAIHLRHPGHPQHRALRRAPPVGPSHRRPRDGRAERRLHGRRRLARVRRRRRRQPGAGRRRDARALGYRRGAAGSDSDRRSRLRHPQRYDAGLSAPRHRSGLAAAAGHEGRPQAIDARRCLRLHQAGLRSGPQRRSWTGRRRTARGRPDADPRRGRAARRAAGHTDPRGRPRTSHRRG